MHLSGHLKLRGFLIALLLLVCQPAWAEKRMALVLGNSLYQNAPQLTNPARDAAAVAATFKNAGFDVVDSRHDLGATDMRRALREFADRSRDADIAVIYYAGHGIEVEGNNYLIPVDAKLERDTDVYDEAFSLDRVLLTIEPAKQLRLVILDACRDNPFVKAMKKTVASRSIGRGLAKVEPDSPNTLIAYSAKAGSTALDGDGNNSPFTTALVNHIVTPGLDVRRAFGFIRDDVMKTTGNRQEPYVYGSLGGNDVALVPGKADTSAASAAPGLSPQGELRRDYELALQLGNKAAWDAFLAQYPDGFYASLAKLQLAKIDAENTRVAATEKARQTEQERARLANEGGQKAQQAKAAADAKAAEDARIAAENAKALAQQQAAEAERKRADAEKMAADKDAGQKTAVAASGGDVRSADKQDTRIAALPDAAAVAPPSQAELAKSVQIELRRVGCLTGSIDGDWNGASQRALTSFNRYAGMKLDVKVASIDALEAIKIKPARICPLICEAGFQADGERCKKIVCGSGSFLNDDNECAKRREKPAPSVRRDQDRDQDRDRPGPSARRDRDRDNYRDERSAPAVQARPRPAPSVAAGGGRAPQSSGQIVCDTVGCRPVPRGCHLEFRTTDRGGPVEGGGGNVSICN
jgi:uncharacterized caspase-like protein